MEIKKLKHCLSFLLSLFVTFSPGLTAFAQDFSRNNSAGSAAATTASALGNNDRTAKPDAISTFTSPVVPGGYDRMWQMTGPFGGDVTVLTIDPNNADRILIGSSDGQIYRSTDGGTIWKRLRPGINAPGFIVRVIHFDRERPNVIYVGVKPQTELGKDTDSGALFISDDNGESWREIPAMRGRAMRSLSQSASDPNVMAIAASDGIYRSADRGKSWEMISRDGDPEFRGFHSIAIDPRDANAIYVGTHHLPWKTIDGGKNWKPTGYKEIGMIDDSDIFTIHIDPDNPNTVMMSACSGIYRSRDAGSGWTKFQGIPYSSRRTHVIYRHPTKPQTIFAGTTEGLWVSSEDGKPDSWQQVTSSQLVINAIAVHPSQPDRIFLGTEDNGVLISTDGGESYEASNAGFVNRRVPAVLADSKVPGRVYSGVLFDGFNGGLFVSEDGGITWQQSMDGMGVRDVYSLAQSPARPETIYAGTNHGVFRSDDQGRNWAQVKRDDPVEASLEKSGKTGEGNKNSSGKSVKSQPGKSKVTIEQPAKLKATTQLPSAAVPAKPESTRPRVVPSQSQDSAKLIKPIVQSRTKQTSAKQAPRPKAAANKKQAQSSGKNSRAKVAQKKKVEPPKPPVSDRVDLQNQVFAILPFTARPDKLEGMIEKSADGETPAPPSVNWLIASTWDGLFFTDDEKKGWKPFKIHPVTEGDISALQPAINAISTSPHAPGVIYIATNDGLYISRDNGASFQLTQIDPDAKRVRSIVFDPRTSQTIYAGTSGGFFRSLDGGKTWEHRGGGMPQTTNVGGLVVSAANPDELYLLDELRMAIFHSKDRGQNWDKMPVGPLPSLRLLAMISDPFDPNKIYAGSFSGGVYVMSRK
jgi:photosystem II stability/assembly factor-like uncharacterized protein